MPRSLLWKWSIISTVGIALGISVMGVWALPPAWAPLAILAILFPFISMIVGDIRKLLLAIVLLDIPLNLDIHFGNKPDVLAYGAIGGLGISVTTIALAGLYLLWLGELLQHSGPKSRPLLRVSLPLVAYVLFASLSLVVASDIALSFYEVFILLQTLLLFFYIVNTVRSRGDVLFIVLMLLVGLVLESLTMIGLQFVGESFNLSGVSGRIDAATRATGRYPRLAGTLGEPNSAATYFGLILTIALSVLMTRVQRGHMRLAALAFGLGGVALILTLSRGGWISFALSFTILCLVAWRRGWLTLTVPLTIGFIAVILSLIFHDAILTRLLGDDYGAAESRVPLMKHALLVIEDNPLLGVGANNYPLVIDQYATPELRGEFLYTVHNKYLLVWAETGIGGFLAYTWFLIATIRRGWHVGNIGDRFLAPIGIGMSAALVGQMAHMLVSTFRGRMFEQSLWLFAGVITAMWLMDRERAKAAGPQVQYSRVRHALRPQ